MVEMVEDAKGLESTTVGIYRTATVVKGGRRFSFSAMVVVGDRRGSVGIGYGKGRGVPVAIEKAEKSARKNLSKITLQGRTLPHPVIGKFSASEVKLIPASPGTGVIAGGTVRAVLEMVGIHDCLTKAYGSTNQKNLCKATLDGLKQLCSKDSVAALRGVEIASSVVDDMLSAGKDLVPEVVSSDKKTKGPVNTVRPQRSGGRNRGGGGRSRQPSAAMPAAAGATAAVPQAADSTNAGGGEAAVADSEKPQAES